MLSRDYLDAGQLKVGEADKAKGGPEEGLARLKEVGKTAPNEAGRAPVPHLVQLAFSGHRGLCCRLC